MNRNAILVITAATALALGGCASSARSASLTGSTNGAGGPTATAGRGPGGAGARQLPRVSGLVAAISGTTAQVQGSNQQTAVTWTSTTHFTEEVPASASVLRLGACVMARSSARSASTPGSPTPTPAPSSTAAQPPVTTAPIAAVTVQLFPLRNGACDLGFGGRPNAPAGVPTRTRTAGPDDRGFAGRRGFGGIAVGTVTSLGPGRFTLTPALRAGSTAARPVTVTYTSATTFTRLTTAGAAAMKVGRCVSAQGRTDDTGALTATAIAISAPSAEGCTGSFGSRGPGGPNGGSPNGASPNGAAANA